MVDPIVLLLVVVLGASHLTRPPARSGPRLGADPSKILDPEMLVVRPKIVAMLPVGRDRAGTDKSIQRGRYWSVLSENGRVWLIGKGIARHGITSFVFANCSASLECAQSYGRARRFGQFDDVKQNLGVWVDGGVVGIGGESGELVNHSKAELERRRNKGIPNETGAWIVRSPNLDAMSRGWTERIFAFAGNDHGCIERYFRGTCKLDTKFSISVLDDRAFVYARANLNETGGGRFVQVTSTRRDALRASTPVWTDFQLVTFATALNTTSTSKKNCKHYLDDRLANYDDAKSLAQNDIYLFAVNPNPVHNGTLLALFPVAVDYTCAAIAMALSEDGVRFSPPRPLVETETYAHTGRTFDHPVDGLVVERDDENDEPRRVHFYLHCNVYGIAGKDPKTWPSHLVRYTIQPDALRAYTRTALRDLSDDG